MNKVIITILFIFCANISFALTNQVVLFGSSGTNMSNSANRFTELLNQSTVLSVADTSPSVPAADYVRIRDMFVTIGGSPGSGKSYTFVVRVNGVSTGLSCTITGTDTSCNDIDFIDVLPSDNINLLITPTGTPTATYFIGNVTIVGRTPGESIYGETDSFGLSSTVTRYNYWSGAQFAANATESNRQMVTGTSGKFTKLAISLPSAPGSGKSYTFNLYRNGSSTQLSCTISNSDKTCVSTNVIYAGVGDRFSIGGIPSGSPTSSQPGYGIGFISNVDGEYLMQVNGIPSLTATNYTFINDNSWNANEALRQGITSSTTLKSMYINLLGSGPGSGKSWQFTINENKIATGLTVTISNLNTIGSISLYKSTYNNYLFDISSVPSGTPNSPTPGPSISTLMYNPSVRRLFLAN